jgi:beta-N-acetylhexosaminidase
LLRIVSHPGQAATLLLICLLLLWTSIKDVEAQGTDEAETPAPDPLVAQLIEQMTPEQRVAQLLLVTFPGADVSDSSMAATLLRDLHVGGVLVRASNGNYVNDEATVSSLVSLTNGLHTLAYEGGSAAVGGQDNPAALPEDDALADNSRGPYIPPFIAIDLFSPSPYYADGLPQSGFTRIPSQMALGATWRPENAARVGQVVGQELEAAGINMLLGPALDVVDSPRPEQQINLGTRTFGGDPFWVGEMGQAFVRGVSAGGQERVATVARHFPGLGSSDRRPDEEIATVQKPLQALQQEDLPPFFAVTQEGGAVVDGLMTTNLRYRGLQGNIRQITRPISLDPQNLPTLINQPELLPWRQGGGILVSDELGALALRRFYAAQQTEGQSFPARTIALDAFNAGNDLLLLSDFATEDDWEVRLANIEQTVQFFTEKYLNDSVFAARVHESLQRLLILKLRLHGGSFDYEATQRVDPTQGQSSAIRRQENVNEVMRIAQESATLLYPGPDELADRMPGPPLIDEDVVIVTDARLIRDCATCPERPIIAGDDFERVLLQRYGPQGGSGQINPSRLTSLTFEELRSFLTDSASLGPRAATLAATLDNAEWLIFLLQNVDTEVGSSDALRLFLRDYSGQVRGQRVIALSFGAPYYLDSTEVTKLTAYFGFYSASPPSVDAAARLLYQEYSATGAPPVTLHPLLNYRLDVQLSPKPDQVIELCLDTPGVPEDSCLLPTTEDVNAGGEIALRTGVIKDHNGNIVPDGTAVTFIQRYPRENNLEQPPQRVQTENGIARAIIPLNREGQLAISVVGSEPRTFSSTVVLVTIEGTEPPVVATVVPTPAPTATPTATPTFTPTPTPTPTASPTMVVPSPTPTPTPTPPTRLGQRNDGFGWWVFLGTVLGLTAVSGIGAALSPVGRDLLVRRSLLVALYGLGGYLVYILPYAFRLLPDDFNGWGAIACAVVAGMIALVREPD